MAKVGEGQYDTGHKVYKRNHRRIDMTVGEFLNLIKQLNGALMSCAMYKPHEGSARVLRDAYVGLYSLAASKARLAFDQEFDTSLMFGLSVDGIDLVNGVVLLSFTQEMARKQTRYQLAIHNELAPYSETWPGIMEKHGLDSKKTLVDFSTV